MTQRILHKPNKSYNNIKQKQYTIVKMIELRDNRWYDGEKILIFRFLKGTYSKNTKRAGGEGVKRN